MLRNIVRVLPRMRSFNRERVVNYAISAFAFLCEFGGNPSFLLFLDALLWRRRGRGREQEPSPAIALSDGCVSETDRFTEGAPPVCGLPAGLISPLGEGQRSVPPSP